jgi:hypothetical protein
MPHAKKRGALLIGAMLLAVVIVAIFVTAAAWTAVPGIAITLAIHLASPVDDDPTVPNNPFKLWLFVVSACAGAVLIVFGLSSHALFVLIGASLLALSLPSIWVISQGRNPWWLRGWLDYRGR